MNKVSLIIKREYITRVSNKRFLLMTFLMPVIFILFIGGSAYFAATTKEESNIAVVDDMGFLKANLKSDTGNVVFHFVGNIDSTNYQQKKYDAVLYAQLNNGSINAELHSKEQMGFETSRLIERQLNEALENKLLLENGIEKKVLDSISNSVEENVVLKNMVEEAEGNSKEANTGLAYGIGFGSGFLIYITMFIFGAMVMRGVAEEKTNRIAEVIVSSCKPFELMLGKIVGIAGVGLTQLLLWIGLMLLISSSLSAFIPAESMQQFQQSQTQ